MQFELLSLDPKKQLILINSQNKIIKKGKYVKQKTTTLHNTRNKTLIKNILFHSQNRQNREDCMNPFLHWKMIASLQHRIGTYAYYKDHLESLPFKGKGFLDALMVSFGGWDNAYLAKTLGGVLSRKLDLLKNNDMINEKLFTSKKNYITGTNYILRSFSDWLNGNVVLLEETKKK